MKNDHKLYTPREIETLFDADKLYQIEDSDWLTLQKQLFSQINEGLYEPSLKTCEEIFLNESSVVNKIFAIQWAVSISEVIYDLPLRNLWLKKWHELPHQGESWTTIFWCQYVYRDQQALGYYFSSNFSEARKLFEKNLADSVENNYLRGEMRSLYHLGLIHKCLYERDIAFFYLNKSLEVAKKVQAIKFIRRIEEQVNLLKNESISFETHFEKVEEHLLRRDLKSAKKLTLHLCRIRRLEKRSWFAKTEHLLLALISYAYGNNQRFYLCLEKVNDSILKMKLLDAANKIAPLNDSLQFEYQLLSHSLGIEKNKDNTVILEGVNFGSPQNSEAAALIQALTQNPSGLNKENIAKQIWKTNDYDPTYHDQKIYRLIIKVRKLLGKKDVISNHYNFYKIS